MKAQRRLSGRWVEILAIGLFVASFAAPGSACSIPVFRYALERWPADAYRAFVLHRGPLTAEQESLVQKLRDARNSPLSLNVEVQLLDLDSAEGAAAELPPDLTVTAKQPMIVLGLPAHIRAPRPAWTGPLTDPFLDKLIDSPARKEIASRLLGGDSAVWVFLESGDAERDRAALETLNTHLTAAGNTLKLPSLDEIMSDELFSAHTTVALKLAFSVLPIRADDPAERVFVSMLLATEPDLRELSGEPMAIPVFGRGRALYALVGKGINGNTILEACQYLVGKCSCQVKEENPGVDLMLAVDWDKSITGQFVVDKELPDLGGLASFESLVNESNTSSTQTVASVATPSASAPLAPATTSTVQLYWFDGNWNVLIPVAIVILFIVGAAAVGTVVLIQKNNN